MANIIKEIEEGIEKAEDSVEKAVLKAGKNIKDGLEKTAKAVEDAVEPKKKKSNSKKDKLSGDEEKEAEKESLDSEKPGNDLEKRKQALLEKAKKLKEKVEAQPGTEELKEKIKIKKRTDMLIPLEDYVKSGIYIGTKVVTPKMRQFVYRRRADGLAILNTDLIDEKLKEGIEYLSKFNPEDVILVCKREAGWRAAEKFSELTGIRVFTKKYPAGILTNSSLPTFFENELTIVTDSWLDRNALLDTQRVNKKVLMICDTNNFPKDIDQIVIGNNKGTKSLGLIFYLLARGYCKNRKLKSVEDIPELEWWTEEEVEKYTISKEARKMSY